MGAKRAVIRIQVDIEAKNRLAQLCDKRGMTQIAVLSRVVMWLTRQSDLVQTAILGGLKPADQQALVRLLLKQMADSKPGKNQPD
jgi:hypothetical protein